MWFVSLFVFLYVAFFFLFFFFKQKTAYEMRISDWSSDVCSSDLWLGAELLVRWNHPERGPLAPDEFVPMAEQARVIGAMNLHLLRCGLQQRRQWPQAEPPLHLSVNVSANDLADAQLVDDIIDACGQTGAGLMLEVTETRSEE